MKNFNFKNGLFYEECKEDSQRCVRMNDTAGREYIFRADGVNKISVKFGEHIAVIRAKDGKVLSIS